MLFALTTEPIDPPALQKKMLSLQAGAFCSFEGWVRDHHLGRGVLSLEYEAYAELALKEGERILSEARSKFDILEAASVHRTGPLQPGDLAIWIGVTAVHRAAAFEACQFIIDTIKDQVPIWKHEFYTDGTDEWVDPASCSCSRLHDH
ncbi:MAG: molybdenum cofactor biosynthesis protein MoaE [Puniceicoccaceae bacterium]